MNAPLVTIVTPSWNKPTYVAECGEAVLAQTFTDWIWWIVLNPESERPEYNWDHRYNDLLRYNDPRIIPVIYPVEAGDRERCHIPARIVNWLYPKVTTPYIYFLADDDLIDPEGLGVLVSDLSESYWRTGEKWENAQAVYGRCEVLDQQPDGSFTHACWCYDAGDVGLGTDINPNCRLDGGQVLHTKALWDRATADGWQLTDNKADAGANDGTLLARLAQFARIHYVPQRIVTHRRTTQSAFHKPQVIP